VDSDHDLIIVREAAAALDQAKRDPRWGLCGDEGTFLHHAVDPHHPVARIKLGI
jgi:hypothetical protein